MRSMWRKSCHMRVYFQKVPTFVLKKLLIVKLKEINFMNVLNVNKDIFCLTILVFSIQSLKSKIVRLIKMLVLILSLKLFVLSVLMDFIKVVINWVVLLIRHLKNVWVMIQQLQISAFSVRVFTMWL